jgi:6-phosphogluconate dehydrogenase
VIMEIGIVGLGRMGGNLARRLLRGGHRCIAYDRDAAAIAELETGGAASATDLPDLIAKLTPPRALWLMVPAGPITEIAVNDAANHMEAGDIIIDGGNTFYKDDIRRAKSLAGRGIHYVDAGTSGGVWGLERGYCFMIGGDPEIVRHLDPIFATLAPGKGSIPATPGRQGRDPRVEQGYIHCGPVGSGHFVKMIHNGIEYGLMQAYAEGFDLLKSKANTDLPADERFTLDVADIAEVWRRGSVISSWLLDLSAIALAHDPALSEFKGSVADSGEGRWTIAAAIEEAVSAEVLAASLFARFRSRKEHTFGEKLLSAMRQQFGGHVEPR